MTCALLLIDIQNDFLPGGALGIAEGETIIPIVNRLMPRFPHVIATQDWHPADHGSFACHHPDHQVGDVIDLHGISQVLWPEHCVMNGSGAELAPMLNRDQIERIIYKGMDAKVDSYSGFFDNQKAHTTGLQDYLQSRHIDTLYIAGLATDYCVKFTALDAVTLGYDTHVIKDACRGVARRRGDVEQALSEMQHAGCHILSSSDL